MELGQYLADKKLSPQFSEPANHLYTPNPNLGPICNVPGHTGKKRWAGREKNSPKEKHDMG